jgi:hypothetical protein
MIVSCPACDTRNHLSARAAAGAAKAQCRACGQQWTEIETLPTLLKADDLPIRNLPRTIEHDATPELEARRLAELARDSQERFVTAQAARNRTRQSWAMLGLFLVAPFAAAAFMPETLVAAAPITIKAYEAMGYDINLYGLDIRNVQRQHAIIDGGRILSVKGDVTNIDDTTRKIPWLRFALVGPSDEELYTWVLDTAARPLRPGESTGFVTRVSAPPEASQNLKIRFARADEVAIERAKAKP